LLVLIRDLYRGVFLANCQGNKLIMG